MSGDSIGGRFDGTGLAELPFGEKTTWAEWRQRHPKTLVLSVDGAEHVDDSPYDNYFTSEKTFRDVAAADERLPAKEAIFAFTQTSSATASHAEKAFAVRHDAIDGGAFFQVPGHDRVLLAWRPEGAAIYASSRVVLIDKARAGSEEDRKSLVAALADGSLEGAEAIAGMDTFWYTWSGIQTETILLEELVAPSGEGSTESDAGPDPKALRQDDVGL